MRVFRFLSLIVLSFGLISVVALSKGLDTLKPSSEDAATEAKDANIEDKPKTEERSESRDPSPTKTDAPKPSAEPTATTPAVASPTGTPSPTVPTTPATPAVTTPATTTATPAPTAAAAVVEKPVEPSAASKRLAERLSLGASVGMFRIVKAINGDWHTNGATDISLRWRFNDKAKPFGIGASVRYTPIEVDSVIDGQSYRGVIEGYHLGVAPSYKLKEKFELVGSVEVGYLLVYLSSIDNFELQEDTESNEVVFTLGFGGDWIVLEKLKFGPRIYAGFGKFQTVQGSVAATFVF